MAYSLFSTMTWDWLGVPALLMLMGVEASSLTVDFFRNHFSLDGSPSLAWRGTSV